MFDKIMGLPAHPLLVHAAVVFVPLLVGAALAYALVPFVRRWITWAVLGLAVIAPFAAWFATLSGNRFRTVQIANGASAEFIAKIDQHRDFGDKTLWAAIGLAVLAVLLILVKVYWKSPGQGPFVTSIVLIIAVVFFAGASAYYVYKTGDSGARMVWGSS